MHDILKICIKRFYTEKKQSPGGYDNTCAIPATNLTSSYVKTLKHHMFLTDLDSNVSHQHN